MKLCLAAFICTCLVLHLVLVQANGAKTIPEDRLKCLACHAVAVKHAAQLIVVLTEATLTKAFCRQSCRGAFKQRSHVQCLT